MYSDEATSSCRSGDRFGLGIVIADEALCGRVWALSGCTCEVLADDWLCMLSRLGVAIALRLIQV